MRLTAIAARRAEGLIVSRASLATESPLDLTLAQGVPKGDKMDGIVRMATELGVTRVVPLLTARTVVRLEPARWACPPRAGGSASPRRPPSRAGARPSRRSRTPRDLASWAREAGATGLLVCLWEEEREGLAARLPAGPARA